MLYHVADCLYQGGIGFTPAELQDRSIRCIVNLGAAPDPPFEDVVTVRWRIEDGALPDLRMLSALADFVADMVAASRPTLVHCAAGINSSGLVCALAYRRLNGCTGAYALYMVRQACPDALSNQDFALYLAALGTP